MRVKLGQLNNINRLIFATLLALLLELPGQALVENLDRTQAPRTHAPSVASPNPTTEQAIQLPEIVARAEELNLLLREMGERLGDDPVLKSIDQSLRSQDELVRTKRPEVEELIATNPTLLELQGLEQDWQAYYDQYAVWARMLTERVKSVEEDLRTLANQQAQWEATLSQSRSANAIKEVIDLIRKSLSEIKATRSKANERLTDLITLQNRVSQQSQIVTDVLEDISRAKAQFQRSLLKPDEPPLWKARSQAHADQSLDVQLRRTLDGAMVRAREYLKARRQTVIAIFAFFIGILSIILVNRHNVLRRAQNHPDLDTAVHLFQHPITLALFLTLLLALPLSSNAPTLIRNIFIALFVVPVLRFLPPLIDPAFRPLLYLLIFFGLVVEILEVLAIPMVLKREIWTGLSLVCIAIGFWLIRPARTHLIQSSVQNVSPVINGIRAVLILISISLLANVFGYVALSRILRSGTILSVFFAVVLYTAFLATIAIFSLYWQARRTTWLPTVRTYGEKVAKWGTRFLRVIAVAFWFYTTLNFFTIRESVLRALSSILSTPIKLGAVHFSLGDVLTFVLIFVLGVLFANVIRVILRDDILARLPLKYGIPYAISTITYYLILLAVFLLALAASGVELSRFTLLTGAFGVGAGFGLQNIISNFFSGIILLFERPIRIGDSLELENVAGDVERIGMRSTSIRTAQGAEVIVPNSILISNQVTNWRSEE